MADPITNAQFVNSLFAAVPAMIQRQGQQRVALALEGMRRQQSIEDQAARFEQAKTLEGMRRQTELDRISAMDKRAGDRADADYRKAAMTAARRAYAKYVQLARDLGETEKSFESFGRDPDEAIAAMEGEAARIGAELETSAMKNVATGLRSSMAALRKMAQLTPDDEKAALQIALRETIPTDTDEKKWGEALQLLAKNQRDQAYARLGPQDRAALEGNVGMALRAIQLQKTEKNSAYKNLQERISIDRSKILEQAARKPRWASIYGSLLADETAATATPPSLEELAGLGSGQKRAAPAADTPPPPTIPRAAAPLAKTYGDSGAVGVVASGIRNLVPSAAGTESAALSLLRNLGYFGATIPQVVGGERLVNAMGLDNSDNRILELQRLRDNLVSIPQEYPWIESTGRSVLRALFPRQQPEPALPQ